MVRLLPRNKLFVNCRSSTSYSADALLVACPVNSVKALSGELSVNFLHKTMSHIFIRAVERLLFLIALIARLIILIAR